MVELFVESKFVKGIHRMDPDWEPTVLSKKIELITGIPPDSQKISIRSQADERDLGNQKLSDAGVTEGVTLFVEDVNNQLDLENNDDIDARYQMDIAEYEKRENTVLDWKRKNKLGRFSEDANQHSSPASRDYGPLLVQKGQECYATLSSGRTVRGIVEFIGEIEAIEPGVWVGVKLFSPEGKNNGTVKGIKLFDAEPNHGTLVRPNKVRPLDEDEEEL